MLRSPFMTCLTGEDLCSVLHCGDLTSHNYRERRRLRQWLVRLLFITSFARSPILPTNLSSISQMPCLVIGKAKSLWRTQGLRLLFGAHPLVNSSEGKCSLVLRLIASREKRIETRRDFTNVFKRDEDTDWPKWKGSLHGCNGMFESLPRTSLDVNAYRDISLRKSRKRLLESEASLAAARCRTSGYLASGFSLIRHWAHNSVALFRTRCFVSWATRWRGRGYSRATSIGSSTPQTGSHTRADSAGDSRRETSARIHWVILPNVPNATSTRS